MTFWKVDYRTPEETSILTRWFRNSRGLRSKDTGEGWAVLSTGTDLKIEDRPKILVFPTTEEIACRGN